ncbi:MAG: PAS domain-containing protein [Synergistaceae bacterium]|jgi:PAS domain-containing protein|nr:PAS domain-containing protein [Synergistaceae bacterium]
MAAFPNLLPIINALPEGVVIISRDRGRIVEANDAFLRYTGFTQEDLLSAHFIDLPFFAKQVRRNLIRLYIRALHGRKEGETLAVEYVAPDQTLRNVILAASRFVFADRIYVAFVLREEAPDASSWGNCLHLTYEPYMEFHPSELLMPPQDLDDRMSFLKLAGRVLRVKYANSAAVDLYGGQGGSLTGRPFVSFFNNTDDAIRFLDMLSVVGQMKAETAVASRGGLPAEVEMKCVVRFGSRGEIAALYCSQRDLSGARRYEAIIGGSRVEAEFTFNQPFAGLAFLTPPHPLERPEAENVDNIIDIMLEQIMVMRANQAMISIYGSDNTKFLMKPMRDLFPDAALARQVLKELFVIKTSSVAIYSSGEDESSDEETLSHVLIFRATFDGADRMNGVLMTASKHDSDYQPRHSNKKNEEQNEEEQSGEGHSEEKHGGEEQNKRKAERRRTERRKNRRTPPPA